jgi:hypothetical protein
VKFCHAASLALVGWYLMVPPFEQPNVPLSRWRVIGSFDFSGACAQGRDKLLTESVKHDTTHEIAIHVQGSKIGYDPSVATCIATNDPRLAK